MSSEHVLIIDDDVNWTNHVSKLLLDNGFTTSEAYSGAEGLISVNKKVPDIILLDFIMGDIDGFEVLSELRKQKIRTKLIIMSVVDNRENVILFIKNGASDYIVKDNEFDDLIIKKINRVLLLGSYLIDFYDDTLLDSIIDENNKLKKSNEVLNNEKRDLEDKRYWSNVIMKIIYIASVFSFTFIFYQYGVFSNAIITFMFPLLLFILLSIPLHMVRKFSSRIFGSETSLYMGDPNLIIFRTLSEFRHDIESDWQTNQNSIYLLKRAYEKEDFTNVNNYLDMALETNRAIGHKIRHFQAMYQQFRKDVIT